MIDALHVRGHCTCQDGYDIQTYSDETISCMNHQACEQLHSVIRRVDHVIQQMRGDVALSFTSMIVRKANREKKYRDLQALRDGSACHICNCRHGTRKTDTLAYNHFY